MLDYSCCATVSKPLPKFVRSLRQTDAADKDDPAGVPTSITTYVLGFAGLVTQSKVQSYDKGEM